jgi:hypothetical protein
VMLSPRDVVLLSLHFLHSCRIDFEILHFLHGNVGRRLRNVGKM